MQLSELCKNILTIAPQHDVQITGLALDSRKVQPGNLFFALPGGQHNGHDFIPQAIEKGASAIVCEKSKDMFPVAEVITPTGTLIPIYSVPHLLMQVGHIANRFYNEPTNHLKLIGVTGTNGKSSCTHFIAHALTKLDTSCALLGTVGNGFPGQLSDSAYTTLDAVSLQATFADFLQQGAKAVAMEVSSHGLAQGRVNGCLFDIAIFTNLSHEHLDYHGSMENYAQAKRKLFLMPTLQYAIINYDDTFGRELLAEFHDKIHCIAYSTKETTIPYKDVSLVYATEIVSQMQGLTFQVSSPWGNSKIHSPLIGTFNVANLLAVISCVGLLGYAWDKIAEVVGSLKGVPGRMQHSRAKDKPLVIIDYAHKPEALQNVLAAIKPHCQGKIWCVFGCGGDRDKAKRPMMGAIAEKYADELIVTNDNPRSEEPEKIAEEIVQGTSVREKVKVILDREQAIHFALSHADKNDMILIAGKGHEQYQEIAGKTQAFSDEQVVNKFWGKIGAI